MIIRTATRSDAPALARLIEEFNSDYRPIVVTPEQAAARLAATAGIETTIVAEEVGQIAGFACLRLVPYMSGDEPYAELTDLFVTAAFRRRGVARALIDRLDALNVNVGDDEVVGGEHEAVLDLALVVRSKESGADELGGMLVEVIESVECHSTAHAGGKSEAKRS